jgi:hypothetical protein
MTSSLDCSRRAPHGLILCRPPPPMGASASFMFVPLSSTNSRVLFRFSLIVMMGCGCELNFRFSSAHRTECACRSRLEPWVIGCRSEDELMVPAQFAPTVGKLGLELL